MGCDKDCLNCIKEYCTDVYRESSRYCNRPEEQKQRQRDYQKRKREEAKANGLCIVCRKKPRLYGSKCYECYIRQKRHDRAKYDGNTTMIYTRRSEQEQRQVFNDAINW